MKRIKCYLSIVLVLSMILCCASVFTVSAVPSAEDNKIAIEVEENLISENELQPMMANGCNNPTTLSGWLDKYSLQYGFTYNDVGLGHDIQLSNGYYYHASAQANYYTLFIYNSKNECVETERFYKI